MGHKDKKRDDSDDSDDSTLVTMWMVFGLIGIVLLGLMIDTFRDIVGGDDS